MWFLELYEKRRSQIIWHFCFVLQRSKRTIIPGRRLLYFTVKYNTICFGRVSSKRWCGTQMSCRLHNLSICHRSEAFLRFSGGVRYGKTTCFVILWEGCRQGRFYKISNLRRGWSHVARHMQYENVSKLFDCAVVAVVAVSLQSRMGFGTAKTFGTMCAIFWRPAVPWHWGSTHPGTNGYRSTWGICA